jgi:LPS export ABC transporter permease LptG
VLLSWGETWAQQGRLPPGIAIWIPNALLILAGAIAIARSGRERARWRFPVKTSRGEAVRAAVSSARSRPRFTGLLRFPGILDRYVLGRFVGMLLLVAASVLVLAVIVDYAEHVDKIAKNHPPTSVVLGYYRCFLLSIGMQIAPFVALIATLIALGVLSKNNEDTAFKASGVSLQRLAAPIFAATALAALLFFALGEYVVPFSAQREARYRNIIYGRAVDYDSAARTPAERNWRYSSDGRIWHQEESDPQKGLLVSPSVFAFDSEFNIARRDGAREASWDGKQWTFRQGWTRTFGAATQTAYRTYLEESVPGDPPSSFARDRRAPEQMRWRELQRYARRLKASGYPTADLETALHTKFAAPALVPLMAMLAIPFAFRIGRRGALAGIGVGLVLGMGFLIATAFFTKLGDVGALPPFLAAWSPNVLAATGSAYLLLRLRT